MTNENIRAGLGASNQARQERIERRYLEDPQERPTFGADAETLSDLLQDESIAYSDLSMSQRIGLGLYDRELGREIDNVDYEETNQ